MSSTSDTPSKNSNEFTSSMREMPGQFVISLDFELHWGVRDVWSVDEYRANLLGVREVVPSLLDLLVERGIHATWATVGFLMSRSRGELLDSLPVDRPAYRNARLDPYADLSRLGKDETEDPFHYAPSLVRLVADAPGQEIATHTFSHFYPLEPGASTEAFAADLDAALALAHKEGLAIDSIVFPRNQVSREALRVCRECGIAAFRGTERAWYHRPTPGSAPPPARALRLLDAYLPMGTHHLQGAREVEGLVNVPASRFLRSSRGTPGALDRMRVSRIARAMSAAAHRRTLFHLWWHPHGFGAEPEGNLTLLESILDVYARLRDSSGMRSMTMREVAAEHRASREAAPEPEPGTARSR